MASDGSFVSLIRKVRNGNEEAAAELIRQYEPEVRRVVRLRLTDPYLRRTLDTSDICQSILANFLVRAALGQFQLEEPQHLLKLLMTMVRNKIINLARDRKREKNAHQRMTGADVAELEVANDSRSPSQVVALRELVQVAQARLSPEERRLADQRFQGHSWSDIAANLGGTPDMLRKRLARAVDRVARELHLEEGT